MEKKTPTKIVAISNQKGGVGKTTTAVNLSASLAASGHPTLLIDFDPQKNATVGIGIETKRGKDVYALLTGGQSFDQVIYNTFILNLSIIPSSIDLAAAELEFADMKKKECTLKNILQSAETPYEYIIIDCPPAFGFLSLNALVAAHSILIPLQCEYYALEGLIALLNNVLRIRKAYNENLAVEGIVLTMYDKRSVLTKQIEKEVRTNLTDKVFDTVIPRNVKIAEAPSHGKPVIFYDLKSVGAIAYLELTKEFLKKQREGENG